MSISAMKQALEALTYIYTETTEYEEKVMDEAIAVLEQAIAEAEKQEPVAQCSYPKCQATNGCTGACSKTAPTAWAEITKEYVAVSDEPFENATPLYTKREWVGLTDKEIKKEQYHIDWTSAHTYAKFARAIEAKLKEKNA